MQTIVAEKNGRRRTFTERTWDLLGPTKEGWVQLPDVEIKNIAVNTSAPARPGTGGRKAAGLEQKVTNVAPEAKKDQPVTNDANLPKNDTASVQDAAAEISEEQKADFRKAADGINAGIIKDFFDGKSITFYKQASKAKLIDQLGDVLAWDVVEFQKLFS